MPTIFDMFTRATEVSSGSGLGLYIVKEIVEFMKGGISIDSREKDGTTVNFFLPNLKGKTVNGTAADDLP